MVIQTKWIDRKFSFDFPVGLLPAIVERLRGTPLRLEALIAAAESPVDQRVAGRWSILEHAGHLHDLDDLHERRLDEFLAGATELSPADMTNRATEEARHNLRNAAAVLAGFRDARLPFVRRLESLSEEEAGRSALHPRLKQPMRLVDMLYFTAEHDDHHLAIIKALATGHGTD